MVGAPCLGLKLDLSAQSKHRVIIIIITNNQKRYNFIRSFLDLQEVKGWTGSAGYGAGSSFLVDFNNHAFIFRS